MSHPERILLLSSNLWNFAAGLLGPLFAVYVAGIGGNILEITGAWALYSIISGAAMVVVGIISDKVGYVKLMIAGYALSAVFTFGYLLVTSPLHLFLVQIGLGLAVALCNPTWYVLYDRHSGESNNGYIWGASVGYDKIAIGLAAFLGGLIVTYFSFSLLFILMGTIHTIATLSLFLVKKW